MSDPSRSSDTTVLRHRLAALCLVIAALGLPINDLFHYVLLLLATVLILAGAVTRIPRNWLGALAAVAVAIAVKLLLPPPLIEEGHNLFIVENRSGALQRELPADAYRAMAAEFERRYPPAQRCKPRGAGCWRSGSGVPDRAFAFSADGIYDRPMYSRRVAGIDFADPVWLRLGFVNEAKYNWYGESDIERGVREPRWKLLHPWRFTMPFFVMYRFPADFVGSRLCWRGLVLWEGTEERFAVQRHADLSCRTIEANDVGRRIFGVSIASPLVMTLQPAWPVRWRGLLGTGLTLLAVAAVMALLTRWRSRQLALPFVFIGLSLLVVFLHDASFIGGVQPFGGGDDGLVYEGMARRIVQHVLDGNYALALQGGEPVFYYGGPGLRYLRAAEHFIFGDTFLGYLSLILLLPFLVFTAFKRFLPARAALGLTLVFIAIPIGALFGSTFFQYVKWGVRGFADPAAATLFMAGFIVLVGRGADGPGIRFGPAFGAGLLFALALWVRPNLAPGAGVLLGGAGLAALWQLRFARLAGLCLGFLPVLGMSLHNWVFGGVFVLFSANATIAEAMPMPPSAYVAAFGELARLDLAGEHVQRGLLQIARWLAGPSESFLLVPLHAAAVAVLVRVVLGGRRFDPWLRLTAGAMLAQHPVALFYLSYDRYYLLAWLLTLLVSAVWMREEGFDLFRRWFPGASGWLARHPVRRHIARALDRWANLTGIAPETGSDVSAAGSGSFAAPPASARRDAIAARTRLP